jgi:hypothetical protein
MDAFNFAFSLFAIILGLSLVEVLTGFARVLKRRHIVSLGWMTPFLAVFVMLDITSFWTGAWRAQEWIEPSYGYLFIGLVVTGLYYLAASIVFPEHGESAGDYDEHYFAHRRQILGAVAICNAAIVVADLVHIAELPLRWWLIVPTYFALLLTAAVTRRRWLAIASLTGLILIYVVAAVTSIAWPWSG